MRETQISPGSAGAWTRLAMVSALAGDLAAVDQGLAVVQADPQPDALGRRHAAARLLEALLDLDGAAHGGERAREFGQGATRLELEDPAAVDRDRGVDHLVVLQLQRGLGAGSDRAPSGARSRPPRRPGSPPASFDMSASPVRAPRSTRAPP